MMKTDINFIEFQTNKKKYQLWKVELLEQVFK